MIPPVGDPSPALEVTAFLLQGTATTTADATGNDEESARVLLTGAVVAGLALVALVVRLTGRWARSRFDEERVATVESALITGLIVTAAGVVLLIWGDAEELGAAVDRFEPDPLFGVRVVVSLLVVAAVYGLTRVAGRLIKRRERGDDGAPPSVDHRRQVAFYLTEVGLYLFASLVVLAFWRVNLGNLLVGAGFLGIVVGLAARQTLGAVIAGFVLLFARPFEVGDWVVIGDREGVVTEINVVNTRLRTFDDEHVMIPNDRVASRDVVNRSREGRLRVTQEVGVDYGADVGRAVEVARDAIGECEVGPLLEAPSPRVVAKRFGDSAVVLELRFWIEAPTARRMWRTRTAVTDCVKEAFEREGIAIPFPQRTLSGREDAPRAGATTGPARVAEADDASTGGTSVGGTPDGPPPTSNGGPDGGSPGEGPGGAKRSTDDGSAGREGTDDRGVAGRERPNDGGSAGPDEDDDGTSDGRATGGSGPSDDGEYGGDGGG